MRTSDDELLNGFEREQNDITITYLEYGEGTSSKLNFPIEFRERHLTEGPSEATVQAIGPELQITIWSNRDNVIIRLPFTEWKTTCAYEQKLTGKNNGILSVGRFEETLQVIVFPETDEKAISGFYWKLDD